MDRRTTIKWVMAASAAWSFPAAQGAQARPTIRARGYGTDPNLAKAYRRGGVWALTVSGPQRRLGGGLSGLPFSGGAHSPRAPAVWVVYLFALWIKVAPSFSP